MFYTFTFSRKIRRLEKVSREVSESVHKAALETLDNIITLETLLTSAIDINLKRNSFDI